MFVSYAQNFEDVILWRALKHVEKGFYIDIGAQDPVIDSVSRGFYEKGWRGIHIEPSATYAAKLRADRPDEKIIQAAIGNGSSSLTFYEIPETGLSTGDQEIASKHKENGLTVVETTVPLLPLSKVFDDIGKQEIHWLKIDVEGMEKSVIDSWLSAIARPWVVVIESTFPNSQEPTHAAWEAHLVQYGYNFVYFDGLSRYYVSDHHRELSSCFGPGPNFFDGFVLSDTSVFVDTNDRDELSRRIAELEGELSSRTAELEAEIRQLTETLHVVQSAANDSKAQAHQWWLTAEELRSELNTVYASRSWKITSPARRVAYFARSIRSWPKKISRVFLEHALLWVGRRPLLQRYLRRFIRRIPAIEKKLISFSRSRHGASVIARQHNAHLEHWRPGDLSPKAKKIYQDINAKL